MKQLKKLISINHDFQKSVNLQLDLENQDRINGYIPTKSSITILNRYLMAVAGKEALNSSILIGPYGKGKSHLLLVLLSMLNRGISKELFDKMQVIAPKTAELVENLQTQKKKYLPVLISVVPGNNLNQTFLYAIREALEREKITEIAPETYFSQAIMVLKNWEIDFPETYQKFCEDVLENGKNIEQYKILLKKNNRMALHQFEAEYPKLTAGSTFNPLLNEDAFKVYQQVNRILTEEYGYSGMFLIFDEFSKYIEGHETAGFSADMKVLQDLCELANTSKNQMFFVMVAHKSIHEYTKSIDESVKNAFRGVEGRIHEVNFVVSAQNNYELISDTIQKSEPEFSDCYEKLVKEDVYARTLEQSYQFPCFSQLFSETEFTVTIAKGCFPMTPLCSYALLHISERVAQNERTIFTFLADKGQGSLTWLLKHETRAIIGIDSIYDYFKGMFRETEDAPQIHNEWLKAEYAQSRTTDEIEIAIIKAVAIIRMIHREDELPAQDAAICAALGLSVKEYETAVNSLKEKDILVYRSGLGVYAFRNNVGRNVEEEIRKQMTSLQSRFSICNALRSVSELVFELPKQYNQDYLMTRYFQYEYMLAEDFFQLEHTEYLFEEKFADGKILVLISEKALDRKKVQKHLDELSDIRVVVLVSEHDFVAEELLLKYEAVRSLRQDESFIEENEILLQELVLCEEDIAFEINGHLEENFLPENQNVFILQSANQPVKCKRRGNFNNILSNICEQYYGLSPKVNHELLNIEHVGSQYLRARNTVIKNILEGNDCSSYEKGTMPEAMVYRAAFVHTNMDPGTENICKEIDIFFAECAGTRKLFGQLYLKLQGQNYGARKGIIPLFLARKLADAEGTAVIYIGNKELSVSAETLNHVNEFPSKYELYIEPETPEKNQYLVELEQIFCERSSAALSKQSKIEGIVTCMQNWYRSLPQYAMITMNFNEKELEYVAALRNLLRKAEINPRELLFDRIPDCMEQKAYRKAAEELVALKQLLENKLDNLKKETAQRIKQEFGVQETASLKACLLEWYGIQSHTSKSHILTTTINGFMNYLKNLTTNNEDEIVSKLSRIILDIYVEDWNDETIRLFTEELHSIRIQVEAVSDSVSQDASGNRIILKDADGKEMERYYNADITDSTSMYLKNTIDEALEEFGDTLEMNQKVAVLVKAIEGLLQ